nr:P1 protein (protease) [Maize dwarf mosaic virus]
AGTWTHVTHKWQPNLDNPRDVRRIMELFAAKGQVYDEKRALEHNSKLLRRAQVVDVEPMITVQPKKCAQIWKEVVDHNPTHHFVYARFSEVKKQQPTKPVATSVNKLVRKTLEIRENFPVNVEFIGKKRKNTTRVSLRKVFNKTFLHCGTRHENNQFKRVDTNITRDWIPVLSSVAKCYATLSSNMMHNIHKGHSGLTFIQNGELFIVRGRLRGELCNSLDCTKEVQEIEHY